MTFDKILSPATGAVLMLLLFFLSGCASTSGVSGSQESESGQGTDGIDASSNYYDTRGGSSAYPYNSGSAVGGQPGSGAGSANRIVYFDFDSYEVRPEYRSLIEGHARQLQANPSLLAVLEGHGDERGTREYNIGLGDLRAQSVRRVMVAMGVSPQQISVVSYGEERPASDGPDETSYSLNRRVEIVY